MLLWPSAEDTIIDAEQKGQHDLVSWLVRNAHYDATRLLLDASRLGLPTLVQEVLADTRIGPLVISQALLIACDHGKCKVIRTILAVIAADLRVIDLGRVVERAVHGRTHVHTQGAIGLQHTGEHAELCEAWKEGPCDDSDSKKVLSILKMRVSSKW